MIMKLAGPARANYGNNRWSVSNIRQWLNSEGAAKEWYKVPEDNIYDKEPADYVEDPGFLAGFSDEVKQHFATVSNTTILCNADTSALSVDSEITEDKVFLPSLTEMGLGNINRNIPEGRHLSKKFVTDNGDDEDDKARIKNDSPDRRTFPVLDAHTKS